MAKKKSTSAPEIQNEIISNWVESNSNRLNEISVENPSLSQAINKALNYLNNFLGGTKKIESSFELTPQLKKWRIKTAEELEQDRVSELNLGNIPNDLYGKYLFEVLDESSLTEISRAGSSKFEGVTKDGYVIYNAQITNSPLPKPKEWRVKTEEEFISEYGKNWRGVVDWVVNDEKNIFFGKPLKDILVEEDVNTLPQLTLKNIEKRLLKTKPELDPRGRGLEYYFGKMEITQNPHPDDQWKSFNELNIGDRFIIKSKEDLFDGKTNGYRTYVIKSLNFKGNVLYELPSVINPLTNSPVSYDNSVDVFEQAIEKGVIKPIVKQPKFTENEEIKFEGNQSVKILSIGYDGILQQYNYRVYSSVDGQESVFDENLVSGLAKISQKIRNEFKPVSELQEGDYFVQQDPAIYLNNEKTNGLEVWQVLSYTSDWMELLISKLGTKPVKVETEKFLESFSTTSKKILRKKPKYNWADVVKSPNGLPDVVVLSLGYDLGKLMYTYWVRVEGQGETLWNDKTLDDYATPLPSEKSKTTDIDLNKENLKIKVKTEAEAIAFQEWAFERGAEWLGGGKSPEETKEKYFFIEDKTLYYAELESTYEEYSLPLREVTLEELGIVVPVSQRLIAVKKTTKKVNWTYLGAQRPNYLEILDILKKRRLSKDDKVKIAIFFGNLSMLTKGSVDYENYEKNREAEAIEYGESFTQNFPEFYQRYEVYTDYQDLIGLNAIVQPTDLVTYDWIQDIVFPMIKDLLDSSNDNLKVRNYIIEVEKQNRGFSLVENEVRAAEEAAKKPSKKSALDKYKTDDDDLESALEDLDI